MQPTQMLAPLGPPEDAQPIPADQGTDGIAETIERIAYGCMVAATCGGAYLAVIHWITFSS